MSDEIEKRKRLRAIFGREIGTWTDAELVEVLTDRYEPSIIPSCRVCGGELSIGAIGGGEPTRWACSPTEDDPDRPGYMRNKPGRGGPGETQTDGHYARSEYVDRRQGGDEAVMELLRRYRARTKVVGA